MEFSIKSVDRLPSAAGVYIFKGHGRYLYVGKSVNIKARVKSHIENSKRSLKEKTILDNTQTVQYYLTENEFQATVLEAYLIKEYVPKYNIRWRDNKNFLYIKITIAEKYPKVLLSRRNEDDHQSLYFGPFSSVKKTEEILRLLRNVVPFCTQKNIGKTACFYSKIGLCHPCPSYIESLKNGQLRRELSAKYKQNIKKLIKLLRGKISSVKKQLEKQLKQSIEKQAYEEAKKISRQLDNLNELCKRRFIKGDDLVEEIKNNKLTALFKLLVNYFHLKSLNRVEAYDLSTWQGEFKVGAMIVVKDGQFDKSQYRRFKINIKGNDLVMLEELLKRRFTSKSINQLPDLIIVDGGKPQLLVVKKVLTSIKKNIPYIGIAKNPDRILIGDDNFSTIKIDNHNLGFSFIREIRDEAHRFVINYHKHLRNKKIFSKI
ncbi:MAG: GIY-YIG nuclease family protein [Microgenomates group bacterium]